jgi:hypothetical protein
MRRLIPLFIGAVLLSGSAGAETSRILLHGFESNIGVWQGSWKLNSLQTTTVTGRFANAMLSIGDSQIKGGKADITVMSKFPEALTALSVWVWSPEEPNRRPKIFAWEVFDREGEKLTVKLAVDWTGWKKQELDLASASWQQTYPQDKGNKKLDLPLKSLHLSWFASIPGRQELGFDQLVGTVVRDEASGETAAYYPVDNACIPDRLIEGEGLSTVAVLNNLTDAVQTLEVDYILFPSHDTETPVTPDPVLGLDLAAGCPSETIQDGKVVFRNTLTDGSRGTSAFVRPLRGRQKVFEASQRLDLGKLVRPVAISIQNSDANWVYTFNVDGSADGRDFTPLAGLQGLSLFHHWQALMLKLKDAPHLRYLRFSYSTQGLGNDPIGPGKVTNGSGASHFSLPCMVKVYDGLNDEPTELPRVATELASGNLKCVAQPGQFASVNLVIPSEKIPGSGCYVLGMRIQKSGAPSYLVYRKVFFWQPNVLSPDGVETRFGVNASMMENAENLRAMGFSLVRFENSKWFMLSKERGKLDFHGVLPWRVDLDAFMEKYTNLGLAPVPLMLGAPKWASSRPEAERAYFYPPKDPADYREFAFQIAARYGSKKIAESALQSGDKKSGLNLLKYFEIWNEPDLNHPKWGALIGTFQDYFPILRAGYEGVKKADPAAKVLNGGLAGFHFELWEEMRKHKYADGKSALDFVDIMNIHYYCGTRAPEQAGWNTNVHRSNEKSSEPDFADKVKRLARWRDTYKPGVPIWLTEMGWDTIGGRFVSEKQQAAYLTRASVIAVSAGIDKYFVYREADSGRTLYASCGFIREDKTWKPSAFIYAVMMRRLKGTKAVGEIGNPDPFVKVYFFQGSAGRSFLVAWNSDDQGGLKSRNARTLKLAALPEAVYDSFGFEMKASKQVELGMFPVYIDLSETQAASFAKRVLDLKAEEAKAYKRSADRRLIMFDFGDDKHVAQVSLGGLRKATPVSFDQKWGSGEYGFVKGVTRNEYKHWRRSDALRCDAVRAGKDTVFKVKLPKGRFEMSFGFAPFAGTDCLLEITLEHEPVLVEKVSSPDNAWVSDIRKVIEVPADNTVLTVKTSQGYSLWYFLTFTEMDS